MYKVKYKMDFKNWKVIETVDMPVDSWIRMRDLRKVMFVLSMNWPRMGDKARKKWAAKLQATCQGIVQDCERFLNAP